ncbi:MAG: carboxypeptidase-like regulatory domain-containing protein, partial [Myxococcota bacterium]
MGTVTGRVVIAGDGAGLAAAVTLRATDSDEPARHARSGVDGNFRIEGVPPGRWRAEAVAPGYFARESIEFAVGRGFAPTLALIRGGVLSGRVVDQRGVPVVGAVVSAHGSAADGRALAMSEASHLSRLRRASGRASSGGPGPQGAAMPGRDFVARGELGVMLGPIPYPPPKGAAALRIARALDNDDDKDDESASASDGTSAITALPVHPDVEPRFVSDSDGRFRITGLEPGTYDLRAAHPDFADGQSAPQTVRAGQTVGDVAVVMVPGVMLVGQVESQNGEIIVGATIVAEPLTGAAAAGLDPARAASAALAGAIGQASPGRPRAATGHTRLQAVTGHTRPQAVTGHNRLQAVTGHNRLQAVTGIDGRYQLGPIAHPALDDAL